MNYEDKASKIETLKNKEKRAMEELNGKEQKKKEYPIATNSGKNVVVAGVNEVENNGVQRALSLLKAIGDSILFLFRSIQGTQNWFTS